MGMTFLWLVRVVMEGVVLGLVVIGDETRLRFEFEEGASGFPMEGVSKHVYQVSFSHKHALSDTW